MSCSDAETAFVFQFEDRNEFLFLGLHGNVQGSREKMNQSTMFSGSSFLSRYGAKVEKWEAETSQPLHETPVTLRLSLEHFGNEGQWAIKSFLLGRHSSPVIGKEEG